MGIYNRKIVYLRWKIKRNENLNIFEKKIIYRDDKNIKKYKNHAVILADEFVSYDFPFAKKRKQAV